MYQLILIIHVLAAVSLIGLVLIQQGKGAAIGSAFGSGASQTVFGSRGSGSFLLRITIGFVLIFFATSISLNYIASRVVKQESQQTLNLPVIPDTTAPAVPNANDVVPPPVSPNSIPGLNLKK